MIHVRNRDCFDVVIHQYYYVVSFLCIFVVSFLCLFASVNIFCGSVSCYDVLGVEKTADIKQIKKVNSLSVVRLLVLYSLELVPCPIAHFFIGLSQDISY